MPVQRDNKKKKAGSGKKTAEGKSFAPKSGRSLYATGDDIIERAKADAAKKKMQAEKRKAGSAFRFFVPQGEEKEIVILDENIKKGLGVDQHRLKDNKGNWGRFEPCIGADDNCPLCKSGNNASYVVMLSVIDMSGYTDGKGNEVPYCKRLLPITSNQLSEFLDLQEANGGSLRGMYLVMKRGDGDKSYAIGSPKTLKGGVTYQVYSEDELVENFGNKPKKDKKTGEIVKERNADIKAYDYKKLFPAPSEEYIDALRDEFDEGNHPAGSRKSNAKSWNDDDDDEPEDDDEDEKPKKGRLKPGSKTKPPEGKGKAKDDDEDEEEEDDDDDESDDSDDDDEEEEESKPKKGKGKAKPSARSKSSRDDDEEEDEDDDDDDSDEEDDSESDDEDEDEEEEEKPAKGKGKASKSKPAASKSKGKKKPADDEEEEEDDEDEDSDDEEEDDSEDDDDDSDSDEEDEDDEEEDDDDEEEEPAPKGKGKKAAASKAPAKTPAKTSAKPKREVRSRDEEESKPAKSKTGKKKPFSRR